MILLFTNVKQMVIEDHITNEEEGQWKEVYEVLDEYRNGHIKVSALPLSFYCIKNNIFSDNYGHSNCYTYELFDMVSNKNNLEWIYPYSEELTKQYLDYKDDSLIKCKCGYYDCIVVEKNNYFRNEIENAISECYSKWNDYNLLCGKEKWECSIYVRKEID